MKPIQSKTGLLAAGIVIIAALTLAYVSGGNSTPVPMSVSESARTAVSEQYVMEFSIEPSDNAPEKAASSVSSQNSVLRSQTESSSQQTSPVVSAVTSRGESAVSSSVLVSAASSAVPAVVSARSTEPTVIWTETSELPQTTAESSALTENSVEESSEPASTVQPQTEENNICHATLWITCSTALQNEKLSKSKKEILPADGNVFASTTVEFTEGTSVFDLLKRICAQQRIHMDFQTIPVTGGAYIKGICNLYEYDCGPVSGWMYRVNGEFPNVGCSDYKLSDGDEVAFLYSCDLGADIGNVYTGG